MTDKNDLLEQLQKDDLYKQIITNIPEDQRTLVEELTIEFVQAMQAGAIDHLMKMVENPEFIEAFIKQMHESNPDKF
jgi:hypothetical protein